MQLQAFVGRTEALETLLNLYSQTRAGEPQLVQLEGPNGSGRQALVTRLLEKAEGAPLAIRLKFNEGEDGLKVLLRLYAVTFVALHDNPTLKESVAAHLDGILPELDEPRKSWITGFRDGMDKERPDLEATSFQVTLPRQSPYLALQEILATLSQKHPIVLELGHTDEVLSFTFWAWLTAFLDRARFQKLPVMLVLWGNRPVDEKGPGHFLPRLPMMEALKQDVPLTTLELGPIGLEEVQEVLAAQYVPNRFPAELAPKLLELSQGLPGHLAEVLEHLEAMDHLVQADDDAWILTIDPSALSAEDLLPELPEDNAATARQILQVAAMEGDVFTAKLIAEQLNISRDTVDDLLDELDDQIDEVIFHEPLQSWLYRFKSPLLRRHYAGRLDETARKEQALGMARLIERAYINRAADYAVKAARLYRENGESGRAAQLIGLASSSERPDILQMGVEIFRAFPQTLFSTQLFKVLHLTLLEKVGMSGAPDPLLRLVDDLDAWAEAQKAEDIEPWLAFHRARLLQRKGELEDAVKAANKAMRGFEKQGNVVKEADCFNLLALIALSAGEPGVALEHAQRALRKSDVPPIKAQAQFIRGTIMRARGDFKNALETLKEALDTSAQIGNLQLHLDAGLTIGEILLVGGNPANAVTLLTQLLEVARNTRQPQRERGALTLLAKCEAALQDFQKAIEFGSQSLKLAREMKVPLFEAADLLDLGMFSLARGQLDEAAVYLREAEKLARTLPEKRLLREVLFHSGMVATNLKDPAKGIRYYQEALKLADETQDKRRASNIHFNLAGIYLFQKEAARARTHLDQAAPVIEEHGSADEKKALRRMQEQLTQSLH